MNVNRYDLWMFVDVYTFSTEYLELHVYDTYYTRMDRVERTGRLRRGV